MKYLLIVIIFGLLMGCYVRTVPDELSPYVKEQINKGDGILALGDFNKIKWDKLYILTHYISKNSFDETLME